MANKLSLNVAKTESQIIGTKQMLKKASVQQLKKISSGIYALKRITEYVDQKTLVSVYNAIIQPYFSYCCEVWNTFGETQSTRLLKLYNRAARVIESVPNEVDQQTVLNILGWEPLKEQRVKAKAKIMFKTLNNMGPNCLKELFTFKKKY